MEQENGSKWNSFDMTWPFDTDNSITQYLNRLIVFIMVLICLNLLKLLISMDSDWLKLVRELVMLATGNCFNSFDNASYMESIYWTNDWAIYIYIHGKHVMSFDRLRKETLPRKETNKGALWKHKSDRSLKQTKRKRHICEFPVYWNQALSSRTAKFDFIKFYYIIL